MDSGEQFRDYELFLWLRAVAVAVAKTRAREYPFFRTFWTGHLFDIKVKATLTTGNSRDISSNIWVRDEKARPSAEYRPPLKKWVSDPVPY